MIDAALRSGLGDDAYLSGRPGDWPMRAAGLGESPERSLAGRGEACAREPGASPPDSPHLRGVAEPAREPARDPLPAIGSSKDTERWSCGLRDPPGSASARALPESEKLL